MTPTRLYSHWPLPIVPLARGGADSLENVAIAHPECNRRKGTMLLSEIDWAAT